jgi:hypothetical protein
MLAARADGAAASGHELRGPPPATALEAGAAACGLRLLPGPARVLRAVGEDVATGELVLAPGRRLEHHIDAELWARLLGWPSRRPDPLLDASASRAKLTSRTPARAASTPGADGTGRRTDDHWARAALYRP